MNIYLDIDGVLLANEKYPAEHASKFIKYILANYPNNTYWLTTQCMDGDPAWAVEYVNRASDEDLTTWLKKIKPTTWVENKTEAIDFSKPFLWFDDDLFDEERKELIKHEVLGNWIEVNLRKDPNALGKFLQSFPIPII